MDPEKELALQSMHLPVDGVWMPTAASTLAPVVDDPFWIIYWASVISFILIMAPMFWFAWQYRQKTPDQKAVSQIDHSQLLEISWSVLPLIFFFWVFVIGFRGFLEMFVAPQGSTEVRVVGQKWSWSIAYEHRGDTVVVGGVGAEFKFPKGKPFKLIMTSQDVLHSFFVPNFRIKSDVIPGRYTTVWFEATEAGTYPLLCTEYCGKDHSNMIAKITITETEEEFFKWLDEQAVTEVTPEAGQALYTSKGCNACHSVDGSRLVGPSFKGLWEREGKMADGTTVKADAAYITESILAPNAKVVEGYPPAMPSFQGQLKQDQIDALIAYIKTLK
jgi:cytochrome c oxidase subunit II